MIAGAECRRASNVGSAQQAARAGSVQQQGRRATGWCRGEARACRGPGFGAKDAGREAQGAGCW
ncbi:hypothetical protein SLEP1_g32352 [Rubroshorea leprosula]|uniref:Uncharacterized protein n=1 Tax=Rubroshorea leprosula TaxID=152421 RepID=A0AAV5KD31_9ROSI|nr:hypothetical protein SLEP1_g32352 [Rubroshorea leprosula]